MTWRPVPRECRFPVLDTEAGTPVAVLDHDPAHPGNRPGSSPAWRGCRSPPTRPRTTVASSVIPRSPASTPGPPCPVSTPLSGRHTTVGNRPPAGLADGTTTIVPVGSWRAGTGNVPKGNQFSAGPVRHPLATRPTRTTSPSCIITQQHSFTHSGRQLRALKATLSASSALGGREGTYCASHFGDSPRIVRRSFGTRSASVRSAPREVG
jgi:hypothetical protein